jgi:DNA polymerase III epsilon subunit-like protein
MRRERRDMIVFDTETTGLSKPESAPLTDQPKIIEFAAIKLDSKTLKEKDRIEFLLNPKEPLDEFIIKNCKITDDMLADQPTFVEKYPQLVEFFLGERELVAHNVGFDRSLLTFELMRIDKLTQFPWPPKHICTVEASYGIKNFRLNLSKLYAMAAGGKEMKEWHRAIKDVESLVTCVRYLRKEGWL